MSASEVTYTVEGKTAKTRWAPILFHSGYETHDEALRAMGSLIATRDVYFSWANTVFRVVKEIRTVEVMEVEE